RFLCTLIHDNRLNFLSPIPRRRGSLVWRYTMLRCIPLLFLAVPLLAAEPTKESREDIVKRLAEAKKAQWAQEDIVDPLAANPKTTRERMLMENQKLYDLETVVIDLKRNLAKIDGMQFKEPERRFGNVVIPRGETPKQTLERLTRE